MHTAVDVVDVSKRFRLYLAKYQSEMMGRVHHFLATGSR